MNGFLFDDILTDPDTPPAPKPKKVTDPAPPPKPDPTADALIHHGFAHNAALLDINRALATRDIELTYPWSLPSRLFQFPIEVSGQQEDGLRTVTLRHPLLTDHPFVQHVEKSLGLNIEHDDAPGNYGEWWHAVDLVSAGKWRELLDTARFTTPEHIAGAVAYGLRYSPHHGKKRNGHLSTTEARQIMAALDLPEPADRDALIREHFMSPSPVKPEKGAESWPVNSMSRDPYAGPWGMILATEAGWFAHDRAGFLGWTKAGRERFPPSPVRSEPKPELPTPTPAPAKAENALTDEIGARPNRKKGAQLDLF